MPGGDRTGPTGAGPMTGRGAGNCAGFAGPGLVSRMFGGGFGRGRGGRGGRGWRNMYYATGLPGWARAGLGGAAAALAAGDFRTMTPQQELEVLKQQAEEAADTLEHIRQRIGELEGKADE